MLEVVRELGAAAGLAAVVGLAVLTALHRAHAREVKRLRTRADRGPERTGSRRTAAPGRTPPRRPIAGPAAPRAAPEQTAIFASRRSQPWYGRRTARAVALALVGLLVVGVAVSRLTGDDGGERSGGTPAIDDPVADRRQGGAAAAQPGNVTVAVLNGTTVPGLAASLRDELAAAGFETGVIDVFSDQQLAESVVQYAPGHEADAQAAGRRLGIGRAEPVTAGSRAIAGDATVIVIAGADTAP